MPHFIKVKMDESGASFIKAGEGVSLPQEDLEVFFLKPLQMSTTPTTVQNYSPLPTHHNNCMLIKDFWIGNFESGEIEARFEVNGWTLSTVIIKPEPGARFTKFQFFDQDFPLFMIEESVCRIHGRGFPRTLPVFFRYENVVAPYLGDDPPKFKSVDGNTISISRGEGIKVIQPSHNEIMRKIAVKENREVYSRILKDAGQRIFREMKTVDDQVEFVFDPREATQYSKALSNLGFLSYTLTSTPDQAKIILKS